MASDILVFGGHILREREQYLCLVKCLLSLISLSHLKGIVSSLADNWAPLMELPVQVFMKCFWGVVFL